MSRKENSEVTVDTLLALRWLSNPLRAITDVLRVKEMGPADHIRTKHDAKAFVKSGDPQAGKYLLEMARIRRGQNPAKPIKQT